MYNYYIGRPVLLYKTFKQNKLHLIVWGIIIPHIKMVKINNGDLWRVQKVHKISLIRV